MRKSDAERQKGYQRKLKDDGRSQFKVTLSKSTTEQFEYMMSKLPGKTKSQVMELLIAVAFEVTKKAEKDPVWLESLSKPKA
ncbi:MAG: hypothetical protein KKA55_08160 [Proteobacteria bacterium]|nr:hypothetical protein [Pseudomonadota bacterium]MBU1595489.1 hypothetical protein [Pseudomonadota bacterium]